MPSQQLSADIDTMSWPHYAVHVSVVFCLCAYCKKQQKCCCLQEEVVAAVPEGMPQSASIVAKGTCAGILLSAFHCPCPEHLLLLLYLQLLTAILSSTMPCTYLMLSSGVLTCVADANYAVVSSWLYVPCDAPLADLVLGMFFAIISIRCMCLQVHCCP